MSTTFEIGRMPAAAMRALSHGGDGPTRTFVNTRPAQRGHMSGASMRACTWSSTVPSPVAAGSAPGHGARSVSSTADTSRAIPYTFWQSGRFDVISNSSTSSAMARWSIRASPTGHASGRSMMPSWSWPSSSSRSESIIPCDSTPRSLATRSSVPSGSTAPGSATATVAPASKLRAPQTICCGSAAPMSTLHRLRRSAFGCCSRERTRPTT